MNIEKIKDHLEDIAIKIEGLRSFNYPLTPFNDFRNKRLQELHDMLMIIESFQTQKFSKEEKELIAFIDIKNFIGRNGRQKILDSVEFLEDSNFSNEDLTDPSKRLSNDSLSRSKTEHEKYIKLKRQIKRKSTPFPLDWSYRIKDFINGKLNEELAWTDGLIIKLNTYNHTRSLEKLNLILSNWYKILRAFGRANNENGKDYQIHELKIGSLILTITTVAGVVITLGKAINYILDAVKKSYEIKKHAIELKKLKSQDIDEVAQTLEKAAKIDAKSESEKIANKLISEIDYSGEDKNEVIIALTKAIASLFKFYDEGGETKLLMSPKIKSKKESETLQIELKNKQSQLNSTKEKIEKLLNSKNVKLIE